MHIYNINIRNIISFKATLCISPYKSILQQMESPSGSGDASVEYAPVDYDQGPGNDVKAELNIDENEKQFTTEIFQGEYSDDSSAEESSKSHPPPKNVSRTSKKKAEELFDENLYSLPENPLPESERSSRISISSSSKNKSGWTLSTKAWGGVICIAILLTAGIMTAIYLPFALRENKGKFEIIKL